MRNLKIIVCPSCVEIFYLQIVCYRLYHHQEFNIGEIVGRTIVIQILKYNKLLLWGRHCNLKTFTFVIKSLCVWYPSPMWIEDTRKLVYLNRDCSTYSLYSKNFSFHRSAIFSTTTGPFSSIQCVTVKTLPFGIRMYNHRFLCIASCEKKSKKYFSSFAYFCLLYDNFSSKACLLDIGTRI